VYESWYSMLSSSCFFVLSDHPRLRPKSFLDEDVCGMFSKDYMFFGCIQYINKVLIVLIIIRKYCIAIST